MIKAKRFWKEVTVDEGQIRLDGRAVKTPAKTELVIENPALAELVAQEWRAVDEEIEPSKMPITRMVNSAIDHVSKKREDIIDHLLPYIETDLMVYRADRPPELVARQSAWDEWIDWANERGIVLETTTQLVPIAQTEANLIVARNWLDSLDDYALVGAHDAIALLGSFVLGMALVEGAVDTKVALDLSLIDEIYQEDQWGKDDLATEHKEARAAALYATGSFLSVVVNDAIKGKN